MKQALPHGPCPDPHSTPSELIYSPTLPRAGIASFPPVSLPPAQGQGLRKQQIG